MHQYTASSYIGDLWWSYSMVRALLITPFSKTGRKSYPKTMMTWAVLQLTSTLTRRRQWNWSGYILFTYDLLKPPYICGMVSSCAKLWVIIASFFHSSNPLCSVLFLLTDIQSSLYLSSCYPVISLFINTHNVNVMWISRGIQWYLFNGCHSHSMRNDVIETPNTQQSVYASNEPHFGRLHFLFVNCYI